MAKRKYITINKKDHPRATTSGHVLKHIIVAEQKLGRSLKPGETVHHLDGNKMNNNPDNLIVFATSGDHTAFHGGCEIYMVGDVWYAKRETKQCAICGKKFFVSASKKEKRKYCSSECLHKAIRKTISTEEIIEMLYSNNGNFLKTANELNVSSNAIVHRLKRIGLPYHSKDYKNHLTITDKHGNAV